ncbi:N-terminal glutamine amidase-domain-containing protein [Glomus cerebriforme]|uniref:Protein N-terminal glutamine amidohydrolase n=1 Tax=Glomus cerebriforme TaxID=658196 RepID=A0A397SRH6_9GLOM|nr:N-terminal glutamine amidase-domain-containing protein [Glomus cerebriforme]
MLPDFPDFSGKKLTNTPCYCEENVYHLCKTFISDEMKNKYDTYACFISNENRMIPIWKQRTSKDTEGMVIWDYHVILIVKVKETGQNLIKTSVYDFDTILPFPCDFSTYTQESFQILNIPQYQRKFRIIPAETYLRVFASDRSHMIKEDGTWNSPPPTYPPISTSDSVNNLESFINMTENLDSNDFGQVFNEDDFKRKFGFTKFSIIFG